MKLGFSYKLESKDMYSVEMDRDTALLLIDNYEGMAETYVSNQEWDMAYEVLTCRDKLVRLLEVKDEQG